MSTPAFCALDQAYGDWSFDKPKKPQTQKSDIKNVPSTKETNNDLNVYDPSVVKNDIRSFCPNCNSCLKANDVLQQRIIEQNIWPRPVWVPQYPHAYVPYDPYQRYWANNAPMSQREDFGNSNEILKNPNTLLQIILYILIALFVIQLIECMYNKTE